MMVGLPTVRRQLGGWRWFRRSILEWATTVHLLETIFRALYSSTVERNALLASYVRSALRSPHKCICVLDSDDATQMTQMVTHAGRSGDASQRHGSEARRRDLAVGQDRKRWVRSETLDLVICRRVDPVGRRCQRHRQWARASSRLDAVAVLDDTAAPKPESFD